MTSIVFDCLILPEESEILADALRARLVSLGQPADVVESDSPAADGPVFEELLGQWEREHPKVPIGGRVLRRYTINADSIHGSVNALSMELAKLLTPDVELPNEPMLREFDEFLQGASNYPWYLEIVR
ncbi:hypothetical protein [Corynebacterium ulceribovis]|uniref:hypothetical protein n=1 Tax=Corynebacterium ulceribovis TaxID=487732 RepID=UPI00037DF10F|nr:hypothetical protein [Corynebacterium ulceribovis]